ncbi:hypothetical protein BJY04DRAFT_42296 [Aspergillus karnatakaensis]|uniref:uncharacterized protein n=1 Tax=Aspergillus karnatakaensis TaxID=1810916 RepID=UPI003CCD39B3
MSSSSQIRRRLVAMQSNLITAYCTCYRRPGLFNHVKVFTLHDRTCPLYVSGQNTVGLAGRYTVCNRFLALSIHIMITMTRGAGAFSISPTIRIHAVVHWSPAFELVHGVAWDSSARANAREAFGNIKTRLLQMFHEGTASPTDRLEDGSTLLHVKLPWVPCTMYSFHQHI